MINSEDNKITLKSGDILFLPDKSTNFIYEIEENLSKKQIQEINSITSHSKIRDRLSKIKEYGCNFKFCGLENEIFNANLQMIDSLFPLIISEFLL